MGFKMGGWSAFTKTIAKDAGVEPLATDKEKKMAETKKGLKTAAEAGAKLSKMREKEARDFTPAWEGADISEQRWNSMSKKEKDAYTEKYGD
tara:strand:- start:364 stop:639 length:276 start_codon:yes stop_codon:yes gene_type:complete